MARTPLGSTEDALQALRRISMAEMRVLVAINGAGNLSRAAALLGVTQPSLSQHVRDIEDKLGVKLFVRHRRGLDPTPFGAVMLRLAVAMRTELGLAAEELARVALGDQPPLRIGSMPVASGGLLAVALGRFAAQPGNPACVIVEGYRETLLEHLRRRHVDIVVGRLPAQKDSTGLITETLFHDGAVVIASVRHPLVRRTRLTMKELEGYPWIIPAEDTSFHELLKASMRKAGEAMPRARIASYSMLALPSVVSVSELLGFLPRSIFASGTISRSLHALPINIDWALSPIGVLMRPDPQDRARCEGFLEILRAVAASARGALPHATSGVPSARNGR